MGAFYSNLQYNTAGKLVQLCIVLKCAPGMTASRLPLTLAMRVTPGGQTGAGSTWQDSTVQEYLGIHHSTRNNAVQYNTVKY